MEIDKGRNKRAVTSLDDRDRQLESRAYALAHVLRTMCVPMSKLKFVLLWTILAILRPSVFGQAPSAAKLHVVHDFWGFKEGAPETVIGLAQTSDGFLWLATSTGLFRFDGTRFELFHSPFGDHLLSTSIYSLFAPPSGGLWIGYTFGGFSFFKAGRVTNYSGQATGTVHSFGGDKDGIVWAAASSGLWKFDGAQWQHLGSESNVPLGAFSEARFDREGTLWALTGSADVSVEKQLFYLRPGSRQFETAERGLIVGGFTLDADGYVVTSAETKPLLEDASANAADRPAAYPVLRKESAQIIDRRGSVWVIPQEPVLLHEPASAQRLSDVLAKVSRGNSETYDVGTTYNAKLVDRESSIWFGDPKGIHRFSYSPLTKQDLAKSANGNTSYFTVTPDDAGAVWILASDNARIFDLYFVVNGRVNLRKAPGPLGGFAYRDPDRTIWLGGTAGLWRLVKGDLRRVDLPTEMADQALFLQTITRDRRGGMWVSFGRHGLYRLADGVWASYGGREDLPKTGVLIEFTDSRGRVWFGYTKNTLAVLDGDRVQVFGPNEGLGVGNVTAIHGRGSEIWIGGEFGLEQFDHGRFHTIHATDDELLRGISGIVETGNGDLWLNGLGGIFHVRRSEISEALNNPSYEVKGEYFGRREGLSGLAFQLRPLNTAIEGTDGRLWFATSGGVEWLDPSQSENKVLAPPITIHSVSADDKNYQVGSALKFPAHTSSVQIAYSAVSLSDPEGIHFRYKLQETDRDWHEVGAASPVSYRNLAPGSYHFRVNATDINGVWSDEVATAEFSILPAFYQTGWFIALCVGGAMVLLYMLYMLRVRQLARQFEMRMEERVGERTRIARELHDTLLQSFQGLMLHLQTGIDLLPGCPAEARKTLEIASDRADQAIAEGRDAVQGLRASTVETSDLASAVRVLGEELRAEGTNQNSALFEMEVEGTPRNLHPILRDEVYRITGEALRNAFRHARAQRIEVEILYGERWLRLRIRDDGKGIDPKLLSGEGPAGHYGLHGMRERAKVVGCKLAVWSKLDSGTEVELSIPASTAYANPVRHRSWLLRSSPGKGRISKRPM
jgi:signal transduction histidine kinase/ligand-binding sensor domain-containing protein